jgi:hypothetical protein
MAGTRKTSIASSAAAAAGFAAIAGVVTWFVGTSAAAWLGAGAALAAVILATVPRDIHDSLYPARLQLARFRRSEKLADVLVVSFPAPRSASRRSASAAGSVLRVTDGVAMMPSLRGYRLCAVLESDTRARTAIEGRLRDMFGSEVRMGWASFPEHGVTLESLIAAASDRVPDRSWPDRGQRMPQMPPRQNLAPRSLGASHTPMKKAP